MERWINPITLVGKYATLDPLSNVHSDELANAVKDGELWKLWYTAVPKPEEIQKYVDTALAMYDDRTALPFVVKDNRTGKVIGSTRFCNIDEKNQRVEIGYTWYSKSYQRTAINSECKLLLLTHAFETLGAIAIEFRTHWHNQASRRAIERLGAKQDGVLRKHQRLSDGSFRDTVVFSIIDDEWVAVKKGLEFKLDR